MEPVARGGKKAKLKRNGETEWKQHFHFLLKNKAGSKSTKSLQKKKVTILVFLNMFLIIS